ncbi:hypothetical protein AGMMS49983_04330 [Clostridia bacterium]|nr:hypothetical protein AGMMS49983_04330 [Clostridia bacterium]
MLIVLKKARFEMKKRQKLCAAIAMVLVLIVTLSACSGGNSAGSGGSSTSEGGTFTVGYPEMANQSGFMKAMYNSSAEVVKAAGGELIMETTDMSPDDMINCCEKLISAGVSGLMVTPTADSMLPTLIKMCEDAKVYLAITFRKINDPEIKALVESSPYYVGNSFENEQQAGYDVAKAMGEKGIKEIALISLAKGDTTADARESGIQQACDEYGIKIVAESRNMTQASDGTKAAESFMSSYPALDGILIVSTYVAGVPEAVISAIEQNNKVGQVYMGACDFGDDLVGMFESGVVGALVGGHQITDRTMCAAIVTNAIIGSPLSDKPYSVEIPFLTLNNLDEVEKYQALVAGTIPIFSQEEAKQDLLKKYNPDVTAESLQAVAAEWSVDYIYNKHKDLMPK